MHPRALQMLVEHLQVVEAGDLAVDCRALLHLLHALFHRGGEGVLQQHHEAFFATTAGKTQIEVALTPESAFVLTHAAIGLLRAASAEPELGLDPAALEDELVRLMEAYLGALVAAGPARRRRR